MRTAEQRGKERGFSMKKRGHLQNTQSKAGRLSKRAVRRYLRVVSALLPCTHRQKKEILDSLREMIDRRSAETAWSRTALETEIGTPESIVQTYAGDDAAVLLRRSARGRRAALAAVFAVLLLQTAVLCFVLAAPPGHYEETVCITDNTFQSTEISMPYGKPQTAILRHGTKTVTYYDNRNAKVWSITVRGTFGYIYGTTSKALDTGYEITLYRPDAALSGDKGGIAGNMVSASSSVTYGDLTLLKDVSLTCDAYGRLH